MSPKRWSAAMVPFAVLLFCGCSSAGAPAGDGDPAESDITSGKTALEGDACSTDVGTQKKCEKGLVCALPMGAPISQHTAGVCKKAPSGACAGKTLPACPRICTGDEHAGADCKAGDQCGSSIGDSCTCGNDGKLACTPHPPLGPHCNLVCLP
jgi:hypothetical protein